MKKLYTLLGVVGLIAFSSTSNAQCANDNTLYLTISAPTTVGVASTISSCTYGGEYNLITNLQAGSTYTFETCGDTDFDTQLSLFNDATGALVGYNDDACGLQSSVTFVSDGSNVRVSLDRFNCQDESTCMTILGTLVSGPNATPCNSIALIPDCGQTANFSLAGSGSFDNNGPFGTPGEEQIFEFTAASTGAYSIEVTHSGGGWVDLFQKDASAGCSGSGWAFIDDVLTTANNTVNLVAGTTYYFMIDDENTTSSTGTITINCPGPDPCDAIIDLAGCGASDSFLLTGVGSFDGNGPFSTPGQEVIYSYTAPFTGDFEIEVTHSGGGWVDLFFTDAANGCSQSGWTFIEDVLTSETSDVFLTGGTTYYFMIDDENTTASNGTITFTCPCIPSTTPDGSFTYNGPFTISGSLDNECNDCSLRPSDDQIYEIIIPCSGTYTFETCGTSWDTYLYLTSSFCGGVIAQNDDSPCGGGFSVQSSVTAQLAPGTYYVTVEAFSTFTNAGDFDLLVSGTEDPIQLAILSTTDVTCFGGSDGSATAEAQTGTMPFNFVWSDGQMTATASGLAAGTYTVGGTDANGCVADDISVTINQPDQIEANVTPQNHIIDCIPIPVDLSANPTGGTGGPYTYLWSTGETSSTITVNPNVTTTYSVSVTDANGCTENMSTNSTTVTVLNRCGNNNQKSLICHVPSGNNGNPQTICVSPNALNAHLATLWDLHGGDYCGPCASNSGTVTTDDMNLGDNAFIRAGINIATESVDVSYRLAYDTDIRIEIYDMTGALVDVIFEGNASEGELYDLHLQTGKISSGVYVYQFITNRETHIDKLQIIQE
ncbi:MAG: hypothetical protein AB8B56_04715 [Crocinitomicaceae bacterium]